MNTYKRTVLAAAAVMAVMTSVESRVATAGSADDDRRTDRCFLYVEVHEVVRAPIGWVDFCANHPAECATTPTTPRDVVLSPQASKDLSRVNKWVNDSDQADDRPRALGRRRAMVLPR